MKGHKGPDILKIRTTLLILLGIGGFVSLAIIKAQVVPERAISDSPYLRIDPAKMRGAPVCGECHAQEFNIWSQSVHQTQFATLHQSDKAQSILDNMDFRLAKRESLCLKCHYTATIRNNQARAVSGVSCESCHGAGRDWIDLHNDYGGSDHQTETEEHKAARIQQSIDAGMLRPSGDLYSVAANCFECHTVPNEKLINVGGHPSGSKFELVAWSDSIRHNFLAAQWSSDESNRPQSAERKRVLFLIGAILDYEYSLRGLAEASRRSPYFKAMERRVKVAYRKIRSISDALPHPELLEIVRIGSSVQLVPGNRTSLLASAEDISDRARVISSIVDELNLSSLDTRLSAQTPAVEDSAGRQDDSRASQKDASARPAVEETAAFDRPDAQELSGSGDTLPTVQGQRRSQPAWFPTETYLTTVPGCSCHTRAEEWLLDDPHSASLDLISSPRAAQIARIYGLGQTNMLLGNQICMSCHGTVLSGEELEEVFDAVSCESCHGPSSKYIDPHERGDRIGYELGMRPLKEATIRAQTCGTCHHITDERLLSAGHPTGENYDFVAANGAIEHWPDTQNIKRSDPYPAVGTRELASAFSLLRANRRVPAVVVVEESPTSTQPSRSSRPSSPVAQAPAVGTFTFRASPRISQSVVPGSLDLPPPVSVSDSTSTEELLLAVKRSLEAIYRALGRGN